MLKHFIFIFTSLLLLPGKLEGNLCKIANRSKQYECCVKKYEEFCCAFVTKCDSTNNGNKSENSNSSIAKNRPECSLPYQTSACLGGYFKGVNSEVLACPDGFYCPLALTCIIPCATGSVCIRTHLNQSISVKKDLTKKPPTCKDSGKYPAFINGTWICPGTDGIPKICAPGYYCPNPSVQYRCPHGHFCRRGSTEPTKCPILEYCHKGRSATTLLTEMPIRVALIILLAAGIYYCYRRRSKFKGICKRRSTKVRPTKMQNICNEIVLTVLFSKPIMVHIEEKKIKINIKFKDVRFKLKAGKGKVLLNGVNGTLESNQITAVMGPSGGGKTTLLNILSARATYGQLTGEFEINRKVCKDVSTLKHLIGIVPQDDIMHEKLTPREILTYQARMRLPSSTSARRIKEKVNTVLDLLDLQSIEDTVIGCVEDRILSGGQRKKVNIGMELVADPCVLLLDEPTSGLDSSSSLAVVKALHFLAKKTSLTIAAVIHQPRFEIFSMLDSVILLSSSGKTVYQGSLSEITFYFSQLGYVAPKKVNPADYILDVVNGITWRKGFSKSISRSTIVLPWKLAEFNNGGSTVDDDAVWEDINQSKKLGFYNQFCAFLNREFVLQRRNIPTVLLNYILTILAGSILGAVYKEVALNKTILMATMSSLMIGLTCSLISLRCFNSYPAVFIREASSGVNIFSYYMAVNIAQVPHLLLLPLSYLSLNYLLIFPRTSFKIYYLVSFVTYFNISGLAYVISVSFSRKNGQMAAVVFILTASLLSGSTPSLCDWNDIPVIGPVLYNLSFCRWFVEALFEKEAEGLPLAMRPVVDYYRFMNNYSLKNFKFCITILAISGIIHRLIALLAIYIVARKRILGKS